MSERKRIMYLKDSSGKYIGVMVAIEDEEGNLRFGMSRYHSTKEHLPFTKKMAKRIAIGRAKKCDFYFVDCGTVVSGMRSHSIPEQYSKHVEYFLTQALKRLGADKVENVY